jgi:methylmalonyl-CoA/ethylmalonyl-CoA epimerase
MDKNSAAEKLLFLNFDHIGFIVRDLNKAVAHYEAIGFGPFARSTRKLTVIERRSVSQGEYKLDVMTAKIGNVNLEFIQPISGDSLWQDFLDKHGEGINHIGLLVKGFDKELAKAEKMGFKVLTAAKFQGGGGAAYFDTSKVGGILLEIVEWPTETK